jgi:serine/threonine-protein kinase RsbW
MKAATVTVTIPAQSRFVALARVTATSLGAEVGMDVDELDDLRMGVDELVAALVTATSDHATIELRYELQPSALVVTGRLEGGGGARLDELGRHIVSAVADDFSIEDGEFRLEKRRGASAR